jgi:Zyg-11 family protein
MDNHLKSIDIQINSTLCLWRLARNQLVEKVEPKILKKVIDNTLTAMELFPNERKLEKNCLGILCSNLIVQEISFDKFKCIQLVLDSLVKFKDN